MKSVPRNEQNGRSEEAASFGEKRLTPGQAVRIKCRECIACEDMRGSFDCLCVDCGLYSANPFRGREMPASMMPIVDGKIPERILQEEDRLRQIAAKMPRRKASASMIKNYCRNECQPGDRTDCQGHDCPFYAWCPFNPNRIHKPKVSKRKSIASRQNLLQGQQKLTERAGKSLSEGDLVSQYDDTRPEDRKVPRETSPRENSINAPPDRGNRSMSRSTMLSAYSKRH